MATTEYHDVPREGFGRQAQVVSRTFCAGGYQFVAVIKTTDNANSDGGIAVAQIFVPAKGKDAPQPASCQDNKEDLKR